MAFHGKQGPKPHHAKPWDNDEARKAAKMGSVRDFFKPPPKPGRPAATGLPAKKRGRPPATPEVTLLPTSLGADSSGTPPQQETPTMPSQGSSQTGKRGAASMLGVKLQRTSYSRKDPYSLQRLRKAVEDWDNKSGPLFNHLESGMALPMKDYAASVGMPYKTFHAYARAEIGKRKAMGSSVGKKRVFTDEEEQFVVDVVRRHDRGNDGLNNRQAVDKLHDLRPDMNRKSVMNTFDRTIRPCRKSELTGIVKANSTTVKRTAINVPQQWRWHTVSAA